jgi:hypothetical protein
VLARQGTATHTPSDKSFLLLFFKKEALSSYAALRIAARNEMQLSFPADP